MSDGKPVFDPAWEIVGAEMAEEGSAADAADRAHLAVYIDYVSRVAADSEVALRIVGVDESFAVT